MTAVDFSSNNCLKICGVPIVLVHGGALEQVDQQKHKILEGVKLAAKAGYKALIKKQCVIEAVEVAVSFLENDVTFNAGHGSALTILGGIEMGASIMDGRSMESGSVALVKNVRNPITLARKVMQETRHAFIAGEGASMLAAELGIPLVSEEDLKTPEMISSLQEFLEERSKHGQGEAYRPSTDTVGCVVVDSEGMVASGCSTGGYVGKYVGRIGDAPIPGSGLYCDDDIGAVSTTGHGESILRYNLAHRILNDMKNGMTAEEATVKELCGLSNKFGKPAGAIAVSNRGDVGIGFTTACMAWACQQGHELHYGFEPGQHIVEILPQPC